MSDAIVKAMIYGEESERSNVVPFAEDSRFYTVTGAIEPPYEPEALCVMFDQSSSLRPNVDVLATNVDGFGYRLEPAIDLEAPDADDKIRDSLLIEALFDGTVPDLSQEAVDTRRRMLEGLGRVERLRTQLFLDNCAMGMSLVELRARTRMDLEVTGNAYWEVLRNKAGEVTKFNLIPSISMRLMRADACFTEVEAWQRVSAADFRKVTEQRRFRRYVQRLQGQEVAYFKEFGDPRTVSAATGTIYDDDATFRFKEPKSLEATEVLHFKIHNPISVYGVPRWIGASLAVLGTRDSEEVNLTYFRNKAVPPLAVLVSGGVLASGAADRITSYIKDQIKGKENFHSILVLEAEPATGGAVTGAQGARVRIEIKNLMEAQQQDALFQNYEANNAEKVGAMYRIPRILRGSMTDFNRSTADAAIRYAEQQVFQPERQKVDHAMDAVLVDRGVRFLRFVSNSPIEKDPPVLVEMSAKLVDAGVITPNEAREIAGDAFNKRFDKVDADWARIPVKAAQAGFAPEPTPEEKALAEDATQRLTKPDVKLAPTDAARVLTVNEARAGMNLKPLLGPDGKTPDPKGNLSMAEFIAVNEGKAGIDAGPASVEQEARRLVQLRDKLQSFEGRVAAVALENERLKESAATHHVPTEEWNKWFDREPPNEPSGSGDPG